MLVILAFYISLVTPGLGIFYAFNLHAILS